ncbi:MAG: SHOCT domain-containing protein [Phycisphaerales bacterium]|jgi:hypothetical protein|nr:SHOCT domain-containing protein [Phycisphaerales bacterium]
MIPALLTTAPTPASGPQDLSPILVPSLILVAIILVAWGVLAAVRRRLRGADAQQAAGAFTLQELRQLRDEGTLSQEQFDRAKASVLGAGDESEGPNSA